MLHRLPESRWNESAAAHLLARAAFGGTPAEIRRIAGLGLERALDFLFETPAPGTGPAPPAWTQPDSDRYARTLLTRRLGREEREAATPEARAEVEKRRRELRQEESRTQRQHLLELLGYWLARMASGPQPLREKLALFWHGHFATSFQKVRDAFMMWRQNQIFRDLGADSWPRLLGAVAKDPAMLVWLDQATSRREHPNENFARELLELFAIGEGGYSERDVTEAARALTGWSLDRTTFEFIFRPVAHDPGQKVVLGRSGRFRGDDIIGLVAQQQASSRFIAGKLWSFFAGTPPALELHDALGAEFHRDGQHIGRFLKTMLAAEAFYAPTVVRQQVKSPTAWLVGTSRLLERPLPPPAQCSQALRLLGQELFLPPNVKGWDGGLSWITTSNLLNRYNLAAWLVTGIPPFDPNTSDQPAMERPARRGRSARRGPRIAAADLATLVPPAARRDPEALIEELRLRFIQGPLRQNRLSALREFLSGRKGLDDAAVRKSVCLILATPDFQMT